MSEQQNAVALRETATPPISVLEVKSQTEAIHRLFKEVLQDETHFGVIPGTPKPTLYKAGAEKIGLLLHLAPSFEREMQWDGPHLTVISECTLRHQATGAVIASAGAMCSTRETKYAFRQATRKCPKCNKATIIKGKKEYGGGWVCFAKKGGCGAKWPDGAKEIEGQSEEREENPNLADTYNTVLKMADKRSFVAATLFGTAASDIFTQDVEDFGAYEDEGRVARTQQAPAGAGLPSDEFEALVKDMEAAFERGEGKSWWVGNKAARDLCSDEQRGRLRAVAKEAAEATEQTTKQAGGGSAATSGVSPGAQATPPASPEQPAGDGAPEGAGDVGPLNSDPGASPAGASKETEDFAKAKAALEEAVKVGQSDAFWDSVQSTTPPYRLTDAELEALEEHQKAITARGKKK